VRRVGRVGRTDGVSKAGSMGCVEGPAVAEDAEREGTGLVTVQVAVFFFDEMVEQVAVV